MKFAELDWTRNIYRLLSKVISTVNLFNDFPRLEHELTSVSTVTYFRD